MEDLREAVGVLDVPTMIERWDALLKGKPLALRCWSGKCSGGDDGGV